MKLVGVSHVQQQNGARWDGRRRKASSGFVFGAAVLTPLAVIEEVVEERLGGGL